VKNEVAYRRPLTGIKRHRRPGRGNSYGECHGYSDAKSSMDGVEYVFHLAACRVPRSVKDDTGELGKRLWNAERSVAARDAE